MTTEKRVIAGFDAALSRIDVGGEAIALWEVADLERHVDRHAVLAADDPPEPPYWAHRWTGAAVLAEAVPRGARSAVELGCGLGRVLAAEVLYDRAAFDAIAGAIGRLLAPGGRALVADARRIDTRAFYASLDALDLTWRAVERPTREEGLPLTVHVVDIACR